MASALPQMIGSNDGSALLGALLLGTTVLLVIGVVYYVLLIIAGWKIFEKAGEKGWKTLIPFYNLYIQFKISWKTTFFWVVLALFVIAGILIGMAGNNPDSPLLLASYVLELVAVIIVIVDYYWLCKSFGHGAGYLIGFIFLPWLFALILGFGSSRYLGNAGDSK